MMKRMNAPFILIADPRIEGGAFYLGSKNYEQAIRKVIQMLWIIWDLRTTN